MTNRDDIIKLAHEGRATMTAEAERLATRLDSSVYPFDHKTAALLRSQAAEIEGLKAACEKEFESVERLDADCQRKDALLREAMARTANILTQNEIRKLQSQFPTDNDPMAFAQALIAAARVQALEEATKVILAECVPNPKTEYQKQYNFTLQTTAGSIRALIGEQT